MRVFSSQFFSVKCNRAGVNRGEEVLFTLWVISDSGQCTGKQRSFLQPNSGSTQKTIEERVVSEKRATKKTLKTTRKLL
jgi:hypothetical protein